MIAEQIKLSNEWKGREVLFILLTAIVIGIRRASMMAKKKKKGEEKSSVILVCK